MKFYFLFMMKWLSGLYLMVLIFILILLIIGQTSSRAVLQNCCKSKNALDESYKNVTRNYRSNSEGTKDNPNQQNTDLSMISFGIGTVFGIIIGILMLLIGCGVAFYYCCGNTNNNGYAAPVVSTQRRGQTGWVSVSRPGTPLSSHVSITITRNGVSAVRYHTPRSQQHNQNEEPPRYEDVSKISLPVASSEGPLDVLPTYQAATQLM